MRRWHAELRPWERPLAEALEEADVDLIREWVEDELRGRGTAVPRFDEGPEDVLRATARACGDGGRRKLADVVVPLFIEAFDGGRSEPEVSQLYCLCETLSEMPSEASIPAVIERLDRGSMGPGSDVMITGTMAPHPIGHALFRTRLMLSVPLEPEFLARARRDPKLAGLIEQDPSRRPTR